MPENQYVIHQLRLVLKFGDQELYKYPDGKYGSGTAAWCRGDFADVLIALMWTNKTFDEGRVTLIQAFSPDEYETRAIEWIMDTHEFKRIYTKDGIAPEDVIQ